MIKRWKGTINDKEQSWPVDSKDDEKVSASEETDEQCEPSFVKLSSWWGAADLVDLDKLPVELAEEYTFPGESPDRVDRYIP